METKKWFIYDYYTYAGAPRLEQYVATIARECYMYRLINDEDLPRLVEKLNAIQDKGWLENKRTKKVEIKLSRENLGFENDLRWLYIGDQHLCLRKVKGELNFEDEK